MYLDTGVYLRTKETVVFTLLDYLRLAHVLCHTVLAFIRIHLPFPAGRSLMAWDIWEKSGVSLHCAATHSYNSWALLVRSLDVPLALSPCICPISTISRTSPHFQNLFSSQDLHLLLSRPPVSSQNHFFSSICPLLSRLRAHGFPSLNGLGTEAQ